jgi:hypothetical protein
LSKERFFLEVFPIKHVPVEKETHIDLLLIEAGQKQHYAYISEFQRLMSNQLSKHHATTWICQRCITVHQSLENLREYQRDCNKNPVAKVVTQKPYIDTNTNMIIQPVVKFKNWQFSTELPIVIYADFEAALVDVQGPPNDPYRSSTTKYNNMEPCLIASLLKQHYPQSK